MLAAAGLLEGRRSAAYPALAIDVEKAGGTFVDGPDGRRKPGDRAGMARPSAVVSAVHGTAPQHRAGRLTSARGEPHLSHQHRPAGHEVSRKRDSACDITIRATVIVGAGCPHVRTRVSRTG